MFFDSPTFVRGSDGRIYEMRNDPGSAVGGILFVVGIIIAVVVQGLMAVYNWFIVHYAWTGLFTVLGFITWTGWVHFEHQQGETWKRLWKKFLFLMIIFAGFSMTGTGFTQARHQSRLLRELQGQWAKIDEPANIIINDGHFVLRHEEKKYTIETTYQPQYYSRDMIVLVLSGEYQQHKNQGVETAVYQNTVHCNLLNDTLRLWMPDNPEPYLFVTMQETTTEKRSQ